MKIAILGAGMVGRAMAIDLSTEYDITSFDINPENLSILQTHSKIKTWQADLQDYDSYSDWLNGFEIVVNAVPGFMGYKTLEKLIQLKKNIADISFFAENALDLDELAKENSVTAIVDCGVAPGMSNLLLGYHDSLMKISSFECMVGGLPKQRTKPFEYKAPFSPVDVIEEYTRPSRYVENGQIVIKPALSDPEFVNFEKTGTLESFNTDGLRSILFTMKHIPDMKEKTLRYPGHIDLIRSLKLAGFFDIAPIKIKGASITPLDLTSALLIDKWKLKPGEEEFTIMKIIITGELQNKQTTIEYLLYDEFDKATNTSSMSRTTGYTCTAAVQLIAKKKFVKKGVFPPELLGSEPGCFEFIMKYLEDRNIHYVKTIR